MGWDWARRFWPALVIGVLVIGSVVAVLVTRSSPSKVTGQAGPAAVSIPGSDGTPLSAYLIQAKNSGTSKAPLIVMPASWGSGSNEYLAIGKDFAAAGYDVISYAQRGFHPSQGEVDFADTKTQADVSSVIDWALKNTDADKNRIGMLGLSYGAGMSLLAAERDARIKAVVAMAAWADLGAAMDPNHTLNALALSGLMGSGSRVGTLSAQLSTVKDQILAGVSTGSEAMLDDPVRSASTNVAALNRNKTAVMLANAYQDSLIIPNQLVTFYNELTVPKRLELRPGDHGGPEITGLLGGASTEFQTAMHWLDHYVRGIANGIQHDEPIQLEDVKTKQWHAYRDWASIGTPTTSVLGDANAGTLPTGSIDGPPSTWSRTIKTGTDTVAGSGTTQINSPNFILSSGVAISKVNRDFGLVWSGANTATATVVNGEPRLHITVTPSASAGTFFAYLYDVSPAGGGTLMTYAPYSVVGVTAGTPRTVDVDLGAISWTVPAGHHLALVIDTVDGRYFGHNGTTGSTLTFSSTTSDPASLAVDVAG